MTELSPTAQARAPFVTHFEGNRLFRDYVEEFICPSVTSDAILDDVAGPFEFSGLEAAEAALAAM